MPSNAIIRFAAVLGCAALLPALAAAGASEKIVYSFCSKADCADGSVPFASLIAINGLLYGTTQVGGAYDRGTVFTIDPKTGAEAVLYSFCGQANCADGSLPASALINVNGTLYGVTENGGAGTFCAGGCGVVYALDPKTGSETVVWSFGSTAHDGALPTGLTNVRQKLYGTTSSGGKYGKGTVFSLEPATATEKIVWAFGNGADGAVPNAGVIHVNGTLYGTTSAGGASNGGTVFSIDPGARTEKVIYAFCSQQNCTDGDNPEAGLLDVNGTLYGTTFDGGPDSRYAGVVYSLNPATGSEAVLFSFCSQTNCVGESVATLIDGNGLLVGTSVAGGSKFYGSAFTIDPATGAETDLWSFGPPGDGEFPYAGLVDLKGTFYGTTYEGGADGAGAVFAIKP